MVTNQKMAKLLLNLLDNISGARGVLFGMEDDPDSSQIIEQLHDAKWMIKEFIKENLIIPEADEEDDDDDYEEDARLVLKEKKAEEKKKLIASI